MERDMRLIEKFQQKQNIDKAQKITKCCLRMGILSLHILQNLPLSDVINNISYVDYSVHDVYNQILSIE